MKQVVTWAPRLLGLAFAGFLALFAADVFDTPLSVPEKGFALLMHLVPSFLVLVALAVVWRREWIATLVFPLLAALHLAMAFGRLHWSAYVLIEGPLLLIGLLFLLSWRQRTAHAAGTPGVGP